MEIDGFFSIKDYFNYYLSGVVWLIDFLITIAITNNVAISEFAYSLGNVFEKLGTIATGVLILLVPYLLGFILYPVAQGLRRLLLGKERRWFPSPRKWTIIRSEDREIYQDEKKKIPYLQGKRFSRKEADTIRKLAEERFNISYENAYNLYFHPIRTYVLEFGTEAAKHSVRARDLMSLTESLSLPIPILLGILPYAILHNQLGWIGIPLTLGSYWFLLKRYYRLELDWVKRVYRGFLAIESKT